MTLTLGGEGGTYEEDEPPDPIAQNCTAERADPRHVDTAPLVSGRRARGEWCGSRNDLQVPRQINDAFPTQIIAGSNAPSVSPRRAYQAEPSVYEYARGESDYVNEDDLFRGDEVS